MTTQATWHKNVNAAETLKDGFTRSAIEQTLRYWKAGPEVTAAVIAERENGIAIGQQLDALAKEHGAGLMHNLFTDEFCFFIERDESAKVPEGWRKAGSSDGSYWVTSNDINVQNTLEQLVRDARRIDIENAVIRGIYSLAPANERIPNYLFAVTGKMKVQMVDDEVYFVTSKPTQSDYDFYKRCGVDFPTTLPGCTEVRASVYHAAIEKLHDAGEVNATPNLTPD